MRRSLLLVLAACAGRTAAPPPPRAPTPRVGLVTVTIPPGHTMLEVFAILEERGIARADELAARARDPRFIAAQGLQGDSVEGYLYPDTYRLAVGAAPDDILATLIGRAREAWKRLVDADPDGYHRVLAQLGGSDRALIALASIVQAEGGVAPSELPHLAQVFLNRLSDPQFTPHRLESDPTTRYGCTVPVERSDACQALGPRDGLHVAQLQDLDNPYNTYTHEGLPPGPIDSPSAAALSAVLAPDGSADEYFVGMPDGHHAFARTREEHERNVQRLVRDR